MYGKVKEKSVKTIQVKHSYTVIACNYYNTVVYIIMYVSSSVTQANN